MEHSFVSTSGRRPHRVQPLAVSLAIVWTANLGSATIPENAGVALRGDQVIASVSGGWVALDRKTGAAVTSGKSGAPPNYLVGAPSVDQQGNLYVQSGVAMDAFDADGQSRWSVALPGEGLTSEPVAASSSPTVVEVRCSGS